MGSWPVVGGRLRPRRTSDRYRHEAPWCAATGYPARHDDPPRILDHRRCRDSSGTGDRAGTGPPGHRERNTRRLHVRPGRRGRRTRRTDHIRLRREARRHQDGRDGEGAQHQRHGGDRRRRQGHAERSGTATDPLPEHLRPGTGLDDVPLQRPGEPTTHRPRHPPPLRQLHRSDDGRRRRRGGVRARGPAAGAERALHGQPLRRERTGPRRRGDPRARPVPPTSCSCDGKYVHGRPVCQRRGGLPHRGLGGEPPPRGSRAPRARAGYRRRLRPRRGGVRTDGA